MSFKQLKPNKFEYHAEGSSRVYFFNAREKKLFEAGTARLQNDMLERKSREGDFRDATA